MTWQKHTQLRAESFFPRPRTLGNSDRKNKHKLSQVCIRRADCTAAKFLDAPSRPLRDSSVGKRNHFSTVNCSPWLANPAQRVETRALFLRVRRFLHSLMFTTANKPFTLSAERSSFLLLVRAWPARPSCFHTCGNLYNLRRVTNRFRPRVEHWQRGTGTGMSDMYVDIGL